LRILKMT